MASTGARDPPPPEGPGGWFAGLVSGAGRLLAAVLGPDSPGSGSASSSPESSQSPTPPLGSADHGNAAHFASDNYQSAKEIVLKDCGEGSLAVISEIDPKNAIMQLLKQETYSRSECDTLINIIQERVVDSDQGALEPSVILPIAWQAGPQQDPVAYSSFSRDTSNLVISSVPDYNQEFNRSVVDMKRSTLHDVPCTLSTDRSQPVLKRSYFGTGDTLNEPLRIRPKLNGSNISKQLDDMLSCPPAAASFEEPPNTKEPNAFRDREILMRVDSRKLFTEIPLLGTNNLTFSSIVLNDATANDTTGLHGKPHDDLIETSIKEEPLDGLVSLEPDMMDLAQKYHNTRTVGDESSSVSKLMFQEDVEGARSPSTGLTLENSSMNWIRGANLQKNTPNKRWSPVTNVYRRQNIGNTVRSDNVLLQQGNPIPISEVQEADLGHIQANKRPVGRPKRARRSRKERRLLL